jgi:hypothetical protein
LSIVIGERWHVNKGHCREAFPMKGGLFHILSFSAKNDDWHVILAALASFAFRIVATIVF